MIASVSLRPAAAPVALVVLALALGPVAASAQDDVPDGAPTGAPIGADEPGAWPPDDGAPLRELAARHGVGIGHAMRFDWPSLERAERYEAIVAREFDLVTPESSMKWDPLRPTPETYDFRDLDRLAAFARANDIELHGHPLVWYRLNPDWVRELPAAELAEAMVSHIETVVTRWQDLYPVWDVVNEALSADGGELQDSPFLRAMGPDYLDVAFGAARASDPDATLVYNDYDIGWPNPKGEAALALVDGLVERGVPLDAVGFQMHLDLDFAHAEGFSQAMQDVADRGLDVYVTEFDVAVRDATDFDEQALLYEDVLERCLMQPACRAFQVWGLDDDFSFRRNLLPLPFAQGLEPKPAFYAMRRALSVEPVHPETCALDGLAVASGAVAPSGSGAALARCEGVRLGPGYAELAVRYRNAGDGSARLEVRVAGTAEPVASVELAPTVDAGDGPFDTLRASTVSMPTGDVDLELELVVDGIPGGGAGVGTGVGADVALDALLFDAPAGPVVEGFGIGSTGPGTGPPGGAGTARAAIGGGGALPGTSGGGEPVASGAPSGAPTAEASGRRSGGGVPDAPWLVALSALIALRARYLQRHATPSSTVVSPCATVPPPAGARPPPA